MNHTDKVDEIIDVLLDTTYTWAKMNDDSSNASFVAKGPNSNVSKRCLVNSDDAHHPICAEDVYVPYTHYLSVNSDEMIPCNQICEHCLKLIRVNPKRYGFTGPKGISINEP